MSYDDEYSEAESWMDASIRLHIQESQFGGVRLVKPHDHNSDGSTLEEEHSNEDYTDEISMKIIPPPSFEQEENEFDPHQDEKHPVDYEDSPIVYAQLIEDVEEALPKSTNPFDDNEVESEEENDLSYREPIDEDVSFSNSTHVTKSSSIAHRDRLKKQSTHKVVEEESEMPTQTQWPQKKVMRKGIKRNKKQKEKKSDGKKSSTCVSKYIISRTSLPYTIERNEMTMDWTAVINTNQFALDTDDLEGIEESAVCMTFKSIEEAREACHAYSPPRMHSFDDCPTCQICQKSFSRLIRRPSHCKNCGVCVCSNCVVKWPVNMLPITYRLNKRTSVSKVCQKSTVKACLACDWLNLTFRQALLTGDYEKAVELYSTGNINARSPFSSVRGEHYYPVHCAILGGNLSSFKWLIESLKCPINSKRRRSPNLMMITKKGIYGGEQVLTSLGKSVLDLAMETQELGVLHYLIIEKGENIKEYKNLDVALRTLETSLRHLPEHIKQSEVK